MSAILKIEVIDLQLYGAPNVTIFYSDANCLSLDVDCLIDDFDFSISYVDYSISDVDCLSGDFDCSMITSETTG